VRAALAAWLDADLQPLAKKHLGAEIIKIENMSSYACRNAYGRTHNKLSEHGIANALDIRGFTTAAGKTALVLEDWGTPQREILARIAAEKAAAERAAAEQAAAEKEAQAAQMANKSGPAPATPPSATASSAGGPAAGIVRSTIIDGVPKVTVTIPGAKPAPRATDPAFAISEPDKLGGPKLKNKVAGPTTTALPVPNAPAPHGAKAAFLHAAHAAACRTFGTTLGPEANNAHRNHFHVDMAHRKSTTTKICD
jgi:Extensin-like protein C-terminus